jgi:FMN reductase
VQSIEYDGPVIRVVGINGSLRDGSYTRLAVRLALQGAEEVGAQTQLIDLREYDLIFCEGKVGKDAPPDVLRLRQEVKQAQGIILGTPEYHGSFSGVLKNALDLMGFGEFEGKMVGLVGVSGGKIGATNALNSLRTVGRALHAWVVPEQVSVPEAWRMFDTTGNLKDPRLEDALKEVGRQVARFTFLHSSEQAREFLHLWETAPENPGGGS